MYNQQDLENEINKLNDKFLTDLYTIHFEPSEVTYINLIKRYVIEIKAQLNLLMEDIKK